MVEHLGHQGFGEWTSECRVMASVFPSESYLGLSSLIISQGSRKLMEKEKKMKAMWLTLWLPCDAPQGWGGGNWLLVVRFLAWEGGTDSFWESWDTELSRSHRVSLSSTCFLREANFPPLIHRGQQHEWKVSTTCASVGKSFTTPDPMSLFSRPPSHSWHLHELCPTCVTCSTIVSHWAKFLF